MSELDVLDAQLLAALCECCPPEVVRFMRSSPALDDARLALQEDAHAFALKDPAAHNDVLRVIQTYTSFRAMLHYRLAHAMHVHHAGAASHADIALLYAPMISGRGKVLSGAELHHKCTIGKRFVLDHGMGTVLGETASIGDDCYLLGGVTLGARAIASNPQGKRHPVIGNRVQIGAFARIFGQVTIGDDVFIGPHCTITEDIPAGSHVSLQTSVQIIKRKLPAPRPPQAPDDSFTPPQSVAASAACLTAHDHAQGASHEI